MAMTSKGDRSSDHVMDKLRCLGVYQPRESVRSLGERWDRLRAVPDAGIMAV
jgi:hypothetical protein